MAERLVINTGPLITLELVGALDIVGRLPYEILCPEQVRDELDAGERLGHSAVRPSWLEVRTLRHPISELAVSGLDTGEAAVIQLALERKIPRVSIDEWKGRRAASAVSLRVTGTLGLLARSKKLGLIDHLRPFVDEARRQGVHYHDRLVEEVLREVGEGS